MKTKRVNQIVALFIILILIFIPIETADALSISDVNVIELSDRYALIQWQTDEESNSLVKYDITNITLALSKSDSRMTKNHTVLLTNLLNGTNYFFTVSSTNENGTAIANNSGFYYNFTTDPTDTKTPFIIADLPRYNPRARIDIDVTTEPNSLVMIYVNGINQRNRVVDSTGHYLFIGVPLNASQDNNVEIRVQDPSYPATSEGLKQFLVYADTSPPDVTYDTPLRNAYPTTSLALSGKVEDDSKMPVSMYFYVNNALQHSLENISSQWAVTLNLIEGYNSIKIVARDIVGNEYSNDLMVLADTKPLTITTNLDELSPAYKTHVMITGNASKPYAKITVTVNSKDINIGDPVIQKFISQFTTKKYTTEADDSGAFSVEIELTKDLKLTESDVTTANNLVKHEIEFSSGRFWMNRINIVAVDQNELYNATDEQWVVYTQCGSGGKWNFDGPDGPMPASLPEQILREGFGQFTQVAKLKWGGGTPLEKVRIHSIKVKPRIELRLEQQREGKLKLENELFKSAIVYPINPPYDVLYFMIELNPLTSKLEGEYKWYNITSLRFPFQVEITYSYEKPGGIPSGTLTQIECWDTDIQIERVIPVKNIPTDFLKNAIQVADTWINNIDLVLKRVNEGKNIAFWSCIGTFVPRVVQWIMTMGSCSGINTEQIQNCCTAEGKYQSNQCNLKENEVNACCEAVAGQLKSDQIWNWVCDRTFCPSVMSLRKHAKDYTDPITPRGKSKCAQLFNEGGAIQTNIGDMKECETEFMRAWDSAFVWTYPYKDEFEAAKVQVGLANPPNDLLASLISNIGAYTVNLCSQDNNKKPIDILIKKLSHKQGRMEYSAFRVYPETGKVEYGTITETTITQGTTSTTQTSFADGFELEIDNNGKCLDDRCRQMVSGLDNPPKDVYLPADVQNARGVSNTNDYVLNPSRGPIAALQSVCLPALSGYLTTWKNVLVMFKNCFKTILETGKGDTGVCQAVLTQVLCDLVIDAISCAGKIFNKGGQGLSVRPEGGLEQFFTAISSGGAMMESTIVGRYGSSPSFQALFTERKLIHSVCIGAFTGEWNLDALASSIGESYSVPVQSTCAVVPADRRFMSPNPFNGKTTYTYHGGVLLSAGSDLNYQVELVCKRTADCSRYGPSSNPGGKCDCANMENERTEIIDSGSLKQGDILSKEYYERVVDSDYRYDTIRVTYTWTDTNGNTLSDKCEAKMSEKGILPSFCGFDATTLTFRCKISVGDNGIAFFTTDPTVPVVGGQPKVFKTGDDLVIHAETEVRSPDNKVLPKFIKFTVKNNKGVIINPTAGYERLDEGPNSKDYVLIKSIEKEHFGIIRTAVSVTPTDYGGIQTSGFSTQSTSGRSFAIIFLKNGENKFACVDAVKESDGKIKFNSQLPLTGTTYNPNVETECYGVKFKISTPVEKIKKTIAEISNGEYYYKEGAMTFVDVAGQVSSSLEECPADPVEWDVTATLYYGENDAPTATPVFYNNQQQSKTIKVMVQCLTTPTETIPPKINSFNVVGNPKNIKKNQIINVQAEVTDASGIKEVYLEVNGEKTTSVTQPEQGNLYTLSFTVNAWQSILKEGQNVIKLVAIDKQGNKATSKEYKVDYGKTQ